MAPKQMPLRSADMKLVMANGAEWQKEHPNLDGGKLRWGERIMSRGARDAFTLAVMRKHQQWIKEVGARPCIICGEITACWCEGCGEMPAMALCSKCDGEGLLCHGCTSEGKVHQEVRRDMPEDEAEVTGIFDDKNSWVPFDPPLRIKLQGVPADLVTDHVETMVAQHLERITKDKASSS